MFLWGLGWEGFPPGSRVPCVPGGGSEAVRASSCDQSELVTEFEEFFEQSNVGVEFTTQLEHVPAEPDGDEGGDTSEVCGEDDHLPAARRRRTRSLIGWRWAGLVRFWWRPSPMM